MADVFNFDDGVKEYAINGDTSRVLRVNVSDANLLPRLYDSFVKAQEMVKGLKEYKPEEFTMDAAKEGVDRITELDQFIRKGFDEVFYPGAADIVFGNKNVLAFVGNGDTIYESFMTAFIGVMEKEIKANSTESEKHIQKYKTAYDKQKENYKSYVGGITK